MKVIYGLVDENDVVRYVGACKPWRVRRRLTEHRREGRRWAVGIVELERTDEWQEAEDRWINNFTDLENNAPGGGGRGKGFKLTAEHKAKISAAHLGKKKPWVTEHKKGKQLAPEHRAKLSTAAKLRWQKPEEQAAQSVRQKKRFAR